MDYKKIIKDRSVRLKILRFFSFIPDKPMLRMQYRVKIGHRLNLKNPKRFTEKLQWYKLYYRNPLMVQCVDKYDVRDYVRSKGLENILIPCYGVFDSAEEMDWDALPDRFVMKDTLGGGGNSVIIVTDKSKENLEELKAKAKKWTAKDVTKKGVAREWPYYSGKKHRIIIEKYIEPYDKDMGLVDYKFFCFHGKCEFLYVMGDRDVGESVKVSIFDRDFQKLPVHRVGDEEFIKAKRPENYMDMLRAAEVLAEDFPHVRVDLYCENGEVYFGELTFFNASGYMKYEPDAFDLEIGNKLKLCKYEGTHNKMSNSMLHLRSYIKELAPVRALKQEKKKQKLLNPKAVEKAIATFVDRPLSAEEKSSLVKDIEAKTIRYTFSADEYFLLQLQGRPDDQIADFISDYEHVEIAERMNKARNQAIFDDKALTYQHFGKYYHRECVFAEPSEKGAEAIRRFANTYGDFIAKPIEKAGGAGIEIVHANCPDELDAIIGKLLKEYRYGLFVEELIQQVDSMKALHPSSVNTVRIPTIRVSDHETVIFHPFLRVGRGSSVVDNAGAGGIICALDVESGTVIAARDERGREYTVHPETGVPLIGFVVPQWQSAVQTAKELAQVIPSNRYTGWDLALTKNGWIMVEANARGQFVWQYSTLEGCRGELDSLFKKMGLGSIR